VNGALLQNAIEQTQGEKISLTNEGLRQMLLKRFGDIDYEKAKKDVAPFLVDPGAVSLFEKPVFEGACRGIALI
jgi:hypothetical protein